MSRAVMLKTARDMRLLLAVIVAGVILLEALFVVALSEFGDDLRQLWLRKAIFQTFSRALLGADLGSEISATGLMSIGMTHPLLLAMTWTLLLTACTGATVAEIDRGTADVLLSLPLSRQRVYASVSAVWAAAGLAVSGAILLGVWIGQWIRPLWEPLDFGALSKLAVNYLVLYWCIGAAATCVASFCSRRGSAVGLVLAWLLASVLLNFLAQFWSLAERLSWLGFMAYYRPLPVIRDGRWPLANLAVLAAAGLALWLVGLWWFRRRDIPTA